jgi:hypothetical protein
MHLAQQHGQFCGALNRPLAEDAAENGVVGRSNTALSGRNPFADISNELVLAVKACNQRTQVRTDTGAMHLGMMGRTLRPAMQGRAQRISLTDEW